jgi:hypothetical protein
MVAGMRGFTKCVECGKEVRIQSLKAHLIGHVATPVKRKIHPAPNGQSPTALAFESLPGDPVGKVRWALDMISRGSGQLEASLQTERVNLMAKVAEIDAQLSILQSLKPSTTETVEQPKEELTYETLPTR